MRFLGRRVYVERVVLVACMGAEDETEPRAPAETGVPRRTVHRWLSWWRMVFVASALWRKLRARLVPPPEEARLPASLVERLSRPSLLMSAAWLLAPLTTSSVPDGSRL